MPRFALLFLFLVLAGPLHAQVAAPPTPVNDDPYTVTGIAVDVKGTNGVDARDKAFTEGGRQALTELAARLTGTKAPDLKSADNNTISRLIRSFEVEQEKTSGKRYIGKLTFHFYPDRTDGFLASRGLNVKDASELAEEATAAAVKQRIIVLPVMRIGKRSILWEEKTPWMRAWENTLSDNPQTNFVVPEGSMEDLSSITAAEALAGLHDPLEKIMHRYEARGVVVAVLAVPEESPTPDHDVQIQLAFFDAQGKMQNTSSLTLSAAPGRKPMEWLQQGAVDSIKAWQQAQTEPANTPPKNLASATSFAAAGMLQVTFSVPFANPQQWQGMRNALTEIPGVTRFDILSLSHSRALVQVTYQGSRPAFGTALSEKGLRLEEAPNNMLTLVPAVAGEKAPGPMGAGGAPKPLHAVYPQPPAPPPETEDDGDDEEETPPPPAQSSHPNVPPPPAIP